MRELVVCRSTLGQYATLKATHVEEEVGVVLAVHRHKGILPQDGGDGTRQSVLDVPEDSPAQVHVVFHETHAGVTRPALLVVVAYNVLVVRIGVLSEVALYEVFGLFSCKAEEHVDLVDVARVQPDGM